MKNPLKSIRVALATTAVALSLVPGVGQAAYYYQFFDPDVTVEVASVQLDPVFGPAYTCHFSTDPATGRQACVISFAP